MLGAIGTVITQPMPLRTGKLSLIEDSSIASQERFVARVPEDYPTIQAAVDAVAEGGTVLIGPGMYKENVRISKSLRLVGAGQERVQIQGDENSKDPYFIISFFARATLQVHIQDLTIGDPTFPIEQVVSPTPTSPKLSGTGLWILFAPIQMILHRVTIGGLALGVSGSGMYGVSFPSQIILEEVNLVRNGIGLSSGAQVLVIRSKIEENLVGIAALFSQMLSVYQSSVGRNWGVGITLTRGNDFGPRFMGYIVDNEFSQNGVGISLGSNVEGDWVMIGGNRFVHNERYGVVIEDPACPIDPELPLPKSAPIQILGENNEFSTNSQDLCPADYPWPPGFRK
jgi:hypothetical protein